MKLVTNLIHKLKYKFVDKKRELELKKIEDSFNNGEVILPTDLRDYENLNKFKEKTSSITSIKEELEIIENGRK